MNQALSSEKTDRKKAESIAHDQLVHKCKKVQSIVPARLSEERCLQWQQALHHGIKEVTQYHMQSMKFGQESL